MNDILLKAAPIGRYMAKLMRGLLGVGLFAAVMLAPCTGSRARPSAAMPFETEPALAGGADVRSLRPMPGEQTRSAAPAITVLAPNGGEELVAGGTYTIAWKLGVPPGPDEYLVSLNPVWSEDTTDFVPLDTRVLPKFAPTRGEGSFLWKVVLEPGNPRRRYGRFKIAAELYVRNRDAAAGAPRHVLVAEDASDGWFTVRLP